MSKVLPTLVALATLGAGAAHATPVRLDGAEANLQQTFDNFTADGASEVNVLTEQAWLDEIWETDSVWGGSGMIMLELAGYAGSNKLGIYDVLDPTKRLQLFSGAASAGAMAQFGIYNGQVYQNFAPTGTSFSTSYFGFYLETPDGTWFSQSKLNSDGADHLVAYSGQGDIINTPMGPTYWGSNLFVFGWEDLASSNWDQDYNDMVLLVRDVKGVPEPGTLGLLVLGALGAAVVGRRRNK